MNDVLCLEGEGREPGEAPTRHQVEHALRHMGPGRSFVVLRRGEHRYVQAGGSPGGCVLEWRDGDAARHWRARQEPPVVPFEDDVAVNVGGSRIPLDRQEWFRMDQVIEVFLGYLDAAGMPPWIEWRSLARVLGAGCDIEA